MRLSRREMLRLSVTAGAAMAMGRDVVSATKSVGQGQQLLKTIPSSGQQIPAVGLGTASTFSAAARTPEEHAGLREVLREFTRLGGSVVDTSPSYGRSEETIGELVREIGNAGEIFMATKISGATGREEGMRQMERSVERLTPGDIDLNQVHNLGDWETQLPLLRELKQEGRIRYLGVTVSSPRRYEELERIMRAEPLDFVQVDYAIDNRDVEPTLLPLARDRGMATLINGPFGRSSLFRRVGDRPVPDWAAEFGATSWAHFFLKWLLGSPAVTVVIPATSNPGHLRDNMGAGLGRLPTEAERARMAELIASLPGG
jgi:aryl-alcohol dehydrogenase-like predicted oxidoreductase